MKIEFYLLILIFQFSVSYSMDTQTDGDSHSTSTETLLCQHKGCSFVANTTDDFIHHIFSVHSLDTSDACPPEPDSPPAPLARHSRKKNAKFYSKTLSHQCPIPGCPISTSSISALQNHMCIHTGKKRYFCHAENCAYATIQKHNYLDHIKRHTGEKPYKCEYPGCTYKAILKRGLQKHIKRNGHSLTMDTKSAASIVAACSQFQQAIKPQPNDPPEIAEAADELMSLSSQNS